MKLFKKSRAGITLLEMLAVITLIIIFSSVVMISNQNSAVQARIATCEQQAMQLQAALEAWIAAQPSISAAINAWSTDPSTILSYANSMLAPNSRTVFSVVNGNIESDASSQSNKAFNVVWGTDAASRLTASPTVTIIDK